MSLTALLHSQSYLNCFKGVAIPRTIRIVCFIAVFFLSFFANTLYGQNATTTTVVSDNNLVCDNENIQFTATVLPNTVTGNVQFSDGATSLGIFPATNGIAILNISFYWCF